MQKKQIFYLFLLFSIFFLILYGCTLFNQTQEVATPTITPEGGTFADSVDVTISCATVGATIYYTTDGTDPDSSNGIEYKTPITITKTTTIKAIAYKDDIYSDITTANFSMKKWSYKTDNRIYSSPAIGSDGTIYVGSYDGYLYAINYDGTLKWKYQIGGNINSSPTIDDDGTIYVSTFFYLYAINPDGTEKWNFYTSSTTISSPAIGSDGTIYVGSGDNYLYAINPDGTEKWKFETSNFIESSPAIGSDGIIYVGSADFYLYAIDHDGTLKWKFETSGFIKSSPAIGSDGTIYIGSDDNYLYAINFDGTLKWKFKTNHYIYSSPTIGNNGTIYVGSEDNYLYAINPDGTLKWKFHTDSGISSSPTIGSDGTIYVGSEDNYLYAINPDGTEKWRYETGDEIHSSPAIGIDGTIYVGSEDNYLYAINSESSGLANSPWPKFHKNNKNTGDYSGEIQQIYSPIFNPAGGTFGISTEVTISCATNGVTIYYTTDGSDPSINNGTEYTAPITITKTTTIKAIAYKDGKYSDITNTTFTKVEALTITPEGGTFANSVDVTINCATTGATIYYTTDGTNPDASNGTVYTAPITISSTTTIKAIAYKDSVYSNITTATFTIKTGITLEAPTMTPNGGTFANSVDVTINCATTGTTIYYTTDGSDPTTNGTEYTQSIPITATTTIKAVSYKDGVYSNITTATFTIKTGITLEEPTMTPNGGTFANSVDVTINCATTGAIIYYTIDGSYPDSSNGTEYTSPITITANTTIKAIAYKDGVYSNITTATFTKLEAPTITPDHGTFSNNVDVTISCATNGATIYYTTNGSNPTTSNGTEYTSPITITANTTLKAIAYKDGVYSDITNATFTIVEIETPTLTPAGGTFEDNIEVTISCTTDGATIYYTIDGTDPDSSNGTEYTTPIPITITTTIKAIAYKDGVYSNIIIEDFIINRLKWKFQTIYAIHSSPAIGSDGTIYIGSDDKYLYAINPDGTLKWKFQTEDWISSSPAIGSDGTIYVGSWDNNLYAIDSNGNLKWKFQTGSYVYSSPAIGSDGTIYVGSEDRYLYAIDSNGNLKWKHYIGGYIASSPAIGSNGTIYVGSGYKYLYAINTDGTLKWECDDPGKVDSSPAIGSDGTIYVGSDDNYLYAINTDGTLKWKYQTTDDIESSPVIGSDGTIYVGSNDNYLYAIDLNGTLKWKFQTSGDISSSPAIGSDGTIYVGSKDGYLYSINPDGTLKWKYQIGNGIDSSPAIGSDGTIYLGAGDGYLYAINSESFGLANSPWPKFHRDNKNRGNVSFTD